MDDSQRHERQQTTGGGGGATLRRPMQIVKKRSGPLEDALAELNGGAASIGAVPCNLSSPTLPPEITAQQTTAFQNVPIVLPVPLFVPTPVRQKSSKATMATGGGSRRGSLTTTTSPTRRRATIKEKKDKEKKRSERWLLTRKTWKYMTDAGRKLIPEGAQNRLEDIPKIERQFHQVCANEPRFILWRRKSSYPGATRNSRRRLKQLLSHTGVQKTQTQAVIDLEEARNADHIIDLLQSYLKLDEARKTTTLLGSKTVRPDQTASPSAQRPGGGSGSYTTAARGGTTGGVSARGPGFLPLQPARGLSTLSEMEQLLERLRTLSSSVTCRPITVPVGHITPEILEDKVLLKQIYNELKKQQLHRILGKHSSTLQTAVRPSLPHSSSLSSLFHFGNCGGKQQQEFYQHHQQQHQYQQQQLQSLSAIPATATTVKNSSNLESTVGSTKNNQNSLQTTALRRSHVPQSSRSTANTGGMLQQRQRKPPSTLNLSNCSALQQRLPVITIKKPVVPRTYNSCGTQTSFIQLQEIKRLANEYKERKREEAAANALATDDEAVSDKNVSINAAAAAAVSAPVTHRRKSSIDNEDVSQSVSDTIKRYLRMARKKSVHDDNANRFKRVNYDRNLRNIRAKGEINPPGMDEGNSKATQTLDAWPVITLDYIRGNEGSAVLAEAHADWRKALDERLQKQLDYEEKLHKQEVDRQAAAASSTAKTTGAIQQPPKQSHSSCSSSSAPTSPTMDQQTAAAQQSHVSGASGLLHSSTQFLSNLWHGVGHQHHDLATSNSNSSISSTFTNVPTIGFGYNQKSNPVMQKSKSSSNVGQFVSKKILKSRSKSQTRPSSPPALPRWTPDEKYTWTSENGARLTLSDIPLQDLSEIEAQILQRVAIEKINELNIGINVTAPGNTIEQVKSLKRRPLSKKKAMTTSFFDIGKREDKNVHFSIFGNSLENCIANDKKRRSNLLGTSTTERGSRNSIASLFRSSSSKVRSCESLPASAFTVHQQAADLDLGATNIGSATPGVATKSHNSNNSSGYFSGSGGNLSSTTLSLISRSQSDVRRSSQDYDSDLLQRNSSSSSPPPAAAAATVGASNATYVDGAVVTGERQVPSFVSDCIRNLEEYGMHAVGLFRVSTSKKRVRQLREEIDRNPSASQLTSVIDANTCPHDVATLLKEFLRDLPEPLLCRSLYKAFLETQRIRNRRLQLEAISHLVKLLPPAHRDTLYALLRFLAHVAACSDDVLSSDGSVQISGNKMDSNNLATVFAPNILRASVANAEHNSSSSSSATAVAAASSNVSEQESMADAINVIRIMIDHYQELFRVPVDLVDAIYAHMFDTCPQWLNYLCEQRTNMENTDEIDSASSNTPLSSPPSVGTSATKLSGNLQMFGNDFSADLKSMDQTTRAAVNIPSMSSYSTSAAPIVPTRKIYTRESVMHENAASKSSNDYIGSSINGSTSSSTRRRRSRPRNSDSDTAVHRLLFGDSSSSSNSDPSGALTSCHTIENEQQQQQQQQQQMQNRKPTPIELSTTPTTSVAAAVNRRKSSPFVLDKTAGVVTASLYIPVQMQGPAVASAYDDLDDVFYAHSGTEHEQHPPPIDLSDIPYIEDVYGSLELENFNEGFPITGSLSFGGPSSNYTNNNTNKSTIQDGGGRTATAALPPDDATVAAADYVPTKLKTFRMKPAASLAGSTMTTAAVTNKIESSRLRKNPSNSGSGSKTTTPTILALEPKLPTSISNIGGEILRSKTADFERLSLTNSSNNNNTIKNPHQQEPNAAQIPQPLYKRQAIISSAKPSATNSATLHK